MTSGLFADKVEKGGWTFYIVTPGTSIYRGNSLEYVGEKSLGDLEYFSELKTAQIYGLVVRYEVKKELFLLAMDDIGNLQKLYDIADDDVRKAIKSSFGYSPKKPQIYRDSDYDMDFKIARFVCSQKLNGYAHDSIKSDTEADFHAEIALCEPNKSLVAVEALPYTEEKIKEKVRENKLYNQQREERQRKQPRRRYDDSPQSGVRQQRGRLDFGDSDDEQEPEDRPISRRPLFGDSDDDEQPPQTPPRGKGRRLFDF